ncbi:MAG: hypothetical protein WCO52_04770 [bacterium]
MELFLKESAKGWMAIPAEITRSGELVLRVVCPYCALSSRDGSKLREVQDFAKDHDLKLVIVSTSQPFMEEKPGGRWRDRSWPWVSRLDDPCQYVPRTPGVEWRYEPKDGKEM